MESILTSIKKLLGITEEYTHFDADIVMHINTVLMDLTNLGVGPSKGFIIEDGSSYWTDFVSDPKALQAIKSYMHLRVKLLFDPPAASYLIESMQRQIEKFEWLINVAAENSKSGIVDDNVSEEIRALIAELESENLTLKDTNAKLESSNAEFKIENATLTTRVSSLERTNNNLQVRVNSLEDFSSELQENIEDLEGENSELRTTVSDLEQNKANLEASNEALQGEKELLESELEELEASIKPEQRKTVEITENGTTEILPDKGNTLSGVDLTVNVPSSGGTDDYYKNIIQTALYNVEGSSAYNGLAVFQNTGIEDVSMFDFSKVKYFSDAFKGTNITELNIDLSNAISINGMVGELTTLTKVVITNMSNKVTGMYRAFRDCSNLEYVGLLNVGGCVDKTYGLGDAFYRTSALKEIRFVENCIKVSISFTWPPLLSTDSIQSIIDGLATVETQQTLTLHSDVFLKLTAEQLATIETKNWTVQ